jgi:hypothetical protein
MKRSSSRFEKVSAARVSADNEILIRRNSIPRENGINEIGKEKAIR